MATVNHRRETYTRAQLGYDFHWHDVLRELTELRDRHTEAIQALERCKRMGLLEPTEQESETNPPVDAAKKIHAEKDIPIKRLLRKLSARREGLIPLAINE